MTDDVFASYVEDHDLRETDHDRVWWNTGYPDNRALEAATDIADAFPDILVVGTENRIATEDVRFNAVKIGDRDVVLCQFYPLRANHWTHDVIDDLRAHFD